MTQPEDKTRGIETVVMLAADALRECPAGRFAYLFGSLAMGVARPFSDVDIAVHLEESADFVEERMNLFGRLTDRLETGRVDVVVLNTAPLTLKARVVRCNRLLVDREPFV
jgi:predicted nucleotidyltransferase